MSKLPQIENAIRELSADEFKQLRDWLDELEADRWDRQIEEDTLAGKLDHLVAEARDDVKNGRCTEL